jgi:RNA polymerase sigma-70 factor (ECF subfamily)
MATMRIEEIFRTDRGRILATLIRLLGDFDLAEEALQEAFAAAVEQWPVHGTPANAGAWLVSTARHKAIDRLRRRTRLIEMQDEIARHIELAAEEDIPVPEDRLRLIFTCCHPSLAPEAQVALTLRTLGGLSTEEIARAFLVPTPTMAQRIVRAKAKIRLAGIPYQVPPDDVLAERLETVMLVVYLVFNEGYAASFGEQMVRHELCEQAIRLGRMLVDLLPGHVEAKGLLALMLLHDSRRATRLDASGDIVLLEDQDRSRWDRTQIEEGAALAEAALREGGRASGQYALQAAIAALHARAPDAAVTDWPQIAALYGMLVRVHPSPVVELNRAVALAMSGEIEGGLRLVERLDKSAQLTGYHLLPAVRAELLRRLGRQTAAIESYEEALALVTNEAERRHLAKRLREIRT